MPTRQFRKPLAAARNLQPRIAALGGALALGIAAILFARAGEAVQGLFTRIVTAHPLVPIVLTPAIFVVATWATRTRWPAARGSGIPQVMAAAEAPDHPVMAPLLSMRTALAKVAGTLAMLLGGASVGREGPTVQLSAAIMVAVHKFLRVPVGAGVIIAGGAAGVAAAFNTPLAGVAFAIEELASAFEQRLALLVMLAVMTAGLVSLGLSGDYIYFGAMSQHVPIVPAMVAALGCGVAGGLAGGVFARVLSGFGNIDHGWIGALRARPVALAAGLGLIVAVVGVATQGLGPGGLAWGTGYGTTRGLLSGAETSLWFGPAKFVTSLATALSGAPGGIFAPSLSVGAGLGQLVSTLFPPDYSGAVAMLGMIAYFAGVTRAPLTAVIIVMEMTADRAMILPLFAAALVADQVSAQVCPEKLYHALSHPFRAPGGKHGTTAAPDQKTH
ncbi:chloride channel protein [Novosphingobium sp. AAP1]|uniref:chloride channel protein n=1 Tax=Novosphingobium sp. AAP1 TaxID=1523413 RepID=UPI0006B9F6FA|nr:chloride channel protein [Novosphingobium sp. AAP1]KPF54285.1 chloride channel protein [Novosphingobium sp. AAP1]